MFHACFSYICSRLDYNSDYTLPSRGPPSMRHPPGAYHNSASSTSRSAGATSISASLPAWLVCFLVAMLLFLSSCSSHSVSTVNIVDAEPEAPLVIITVMMIAVRNDGGISNSRGHQADFSSRIQSSTAPSSSILATRPPHNTHRSIPVNSNSSYDALRRWKITTSPGKSFARSPRTLTSASGRLRENHTNVRVSARTRCQKSVHKATAWD